ncbi:MAG: histidinol-phosphatase [Oscillospiraceae bacterium]|nr:histidinol-phosphatase [Oscillospiraceae bacterium]
MEKMIDGHIHIERGPYTLEWIRRFVDKAVEMQLDEIRLLEHSHRFDEFVPMYDSVRAYSEYVDTWFLRQLKGVSLEDYLDLVRRVREEEYPIDLKFGLEICYFEEQEDFIRGLTENKGFDFLLGSVHFVDGFAFDHKAEHWDGIDVDRTYERYFETSISLAESGLFDGIGHPDAIKLFGHRPSYHLTEYYERLAAALAGNSMYADQNSGVFRRCSDTALPGMDRELIRILKKHGVPFITSSDAHCPEDVGYMIRELSEMVREA